MDEQQHSADACGTCPVCNKRDIEYTFLDAGSPYKRDAVYMGACGPCAIDLYEEGAAIYPRHAREIEPGGDLDADEVVPVASARERLDRLKGHETRGLDR